MNPKILLTTILSILLFVSCSALRRTAFDPRTHDEGVVISGVRWATRNVDMPGTFAESPESPGMLYQWNRRVGWSSINPMINSDDETTWDSIIPSGRRWTRSNDPCPPGWRVPTERELNSLLRLYGAGRGSRTNWNNTGVNGHVFGTYPNQIFLPNTRSRAGSTGGLQGSGGSYWSSTQSLSTTAKYLFFLRAGMSGIMGMSDSDRSYGRSVRCVAK